MWKCPNCGSTDLSVHALVQVRLHQGQDNFETEENGSDHGWDAQSPMQCHSCNHHGKAGDFDESSAIAEVFDSERPWIVQVNRVGYSSRSFQINARSAKEAKERALEESGDFEFSEVGSDYDVDDVRLIHV